MDPQLPLRDAEMEKKNQNPQFLGLTAMCQCALLRQGEYRLTLRLSQPLGQVLGLFRPV